MFLAQQLSFFVHFIEVGEKSVLIHFFWISFQLNIKIIEGKEKNWEYWKC